MDTERLTPNQKLDAVRSLMLSFAPEYRRDAGEQFLRVISECMPEEADADLQTLADFVASVGEPPPPIVSGVLPPNSFMLITARPKHGKTFFVLQMADDIASGGSLFGKWEIEKPGPVVYFSMEGSPYLLRERIIKRGMHERNPPVYVLHQRRDFSTEAGVQWMKKKIEPIAPVVVIIDTARQALDMEDWNDAAKVTRKIRPLMETAASLPNGCAVIMVVHNNKNPNAEGGDKISGSNAIQSNCDGYLIIDNKRRIGTGDLLAEVECEGRIDMPEKFFFRMDTETLQIRILDTDEADEAKRETRDASAERQYDRIERVLLAHGGKGTQADMVKHTGLTQGFVSQIVRKMVQAGRIREDEQRNGRKAACYSIPSVMERDEPEGDEL